MANRSLTLRREALADLSSDELRELATGQPAPTGQAVSCPLTDCVLPSRDLYCFAPTFVQCVTDYCFLTETCQ